MNLLTRKLHEEIPASAGSKERYGVYEVFDPLHTMPYLCCSSRLRVCFVRYDVYGPDADIRKYIKTAGKEQAYAASLPQFRR
jgi:hypothetical protein